MSQEQALEILVRTVAEQRLALDQPTRFRALLLDAFKGQFKRERNLLLLALEKGLPADMLNNAALPPLAVSRARARLTMEFGIEASLARWTAEAWAIALGLITELSQPQTAASERRQMMYFPRPLPIYITGPKRPPEGPRHRLAMRPPGPKRPPG